ncbi:NADH dehydrogenase [ubiquinone] iron-sulfur protein 7, mitochondrial isoform 1-T1 [Trichechus inunguis]
MDSAQVHWQVGRGRGLGRAGASSPHEDFGLVPCLQEGPLTRGSVSRQLRRGRGCAGTRHPPERSHWPSEQCPARRAQGRSRGPQAHSASQQPGRVCGGQAGRPHQLGPPELAVARDLWPGLLRRGDDAHGSAPLRHGPLRGGLPRQPAPGRRHDRGRHAHQQDGPCAPQGVRPDAGAPLCGVHGELCQRWRVLSLLVLCGEGLRPHRACRHLRPRLPAHSRGAALRHPAAAEEDQAREEAQHLVPQIALPRRPHRRTVLRVPINPACRPLARPPVSCALAGGPPGGVGEGRATGGRPLDPVPPVPRMAQNPQAGLPESRAEPALVHFMKPLHPGGGGTGGQGPLRSCLSLPSWPTPPPGPRGPLPGV